MTNFPVTGSVPIAAPFYIVFGAEGWDGVFSRGKIEKMR
jgi:hypothetical protein